ncbi:MAG TPA: LOG family protein, partial [Candidatus Dormibacteraeota bacterium]|nr:LOG family protein [Candidatus Dormibacteraeota bacterium]
HDGPDYDVARDFGRRIVERGWMVITGAGPGIMRAGHEGAGQESSFGVNIVLPFENAPNEFIADDPKLINFKYFFTRKLMFIKEADAFALFPGGFGTLDELFELLVLLQTGKSDLHPIVLLERPGGDFWPGIERMMRDTLGARGLIDDDDLGFYHVAADVEDAVDHIERFYRVYHSQRYVGDKLILRLTSMPDGATVAALNQEFADVLRGPIVPATASEAEVRDGDVPDLPRLSAPFDRMHYARLRQLVDRLNNSPRAATSAAERA